MKQELAEIGFEEQEAEVYIALLKKGQSLANEISKETGINRSSVYNILEKLIRKGIVSFVVKNNIKYFSATEPKNLMKILKEKEAVLEKILPELKNIKNETKEDIMAEVYEGRRGGTTILKDIINTGEDYIGIGGEEQFEKVFAFYSIQYVKEIQKKNIKERLLVTNGAKINRLGKTSRIRYLPKQFFIPNTSTIVYGNKVGFVIYKKPFYVVLIHSEALADSYRTFFNALWNMAKSK